MNAPLNLTRPRSKRPTSRTTQLVITNVSRRTFLQGVSALGGLVLAVGYPGALRAEDTPKYGADAMPHGWVDNPLVFVAIGEDGIVTIVCHRSEMGQGVRTGMPMIVADELEADWTRVARRAGSGRRGALRQSGHGRLAQHTAFLHAHAALRCGGASDAGSRCGRALAGARRRRPGEEQ